MANKGTSKKNTRHKIYLKGNYTSQNIQQTATVRPLNSKIQNKIGKITVRQKINSKNLLSGTIIEKALYPVTCEETKKQNEYTSVYG